MESILIDLKLWPSANGPWYLFECDSPDWASKFWMVLKIQRQTVKTCEWLVKPESNFSICECIQENRRQKEVIRSILESRITSDQSPTFVNMKVKCHETLFCNFCRKSIVIALVFNYFDSVWPYQKADRFIHPTLDIFNSFCLFFCNFCRKSAMMVLVFNYFDFVWPYQKADRFIHPILNIFNSFCLFYVYHFESSTIKVSNTMLFDSLKEILSR